MRDTIPVKIRGSCFLAVVSGSDFWAVLDLSGRYVVLRVYGNA
jgi:hypothetical protein